METLYKILALISKNIKIAFVIGTIICILAIFVSSIWWWVLSVPLAYFIGEVIKIIIDNNIEDIDIEEVINKEQDKHSKGLDYMYKGIVSIFFFLAGYSMFRGLEILFPQNFWNYIFISFFTIVVTAVLLYLALKIKIERKNILILAFLYIVFDIPSALIFNFVHFYNHISTTQRMDSDMNACSAYRDVQGKNVKAITQFSNAINNAVNASYDNFNNTTIEVPLIKQLSELMDKCSDKESTEYKNYEKRLNNLPSYKSESEIFNKIPWNRIKTFIKNANELDAKMSNLRILCNKYKMKDGFTLLQLDSAKTLTQEINSCFEILINEGSAIESEITSLNNKKNYDKKYLISFVFPKEITTNDEIILYAMYRMENRAISKFSCLNDLWILLKSFISKSEKEEGNVNNTENNMNDKNKSRKEFENKERTFENQLLWQSAALSILIDLLPLILSVYIAVNKKKGQ